jgi:hypothetical protein
LHLASDGYEPPPGTGPPGARRPDSNRPGTVQKSSSP